MHQGLLSSQHIWQQVQTEVVTLSTRSRSPQKSLHASLGDLLCKGIYSVILGSSPSVREALQDDQSTCTSLLEEG